MASFNPKADAQHLKDVIDTKDDSGIMEVVHLLKQRSNAERQKIKRQYRALFKSEMSEDINKAFKGHDDVLSALLNLPEDYDAKELYGSMKGIGTKEATMTEIMCSRDNSEIQLAAYAYRHWYGKSLQEDIESEISGDYKALITGLLKACRDESNNVDPGRARHTAEILNDKKNDEETFESVLTQMSYPQICSVATEYSAIAGKTFEDGIKKAYGGDAELAALSIYRVAQSKPAYFAELIHDSVKKGHSDVLLRICGSRETKDLPHIKHAFEEKYKMPLGNFITDYLKDNKTALARDTCLTLLGC